MTRTAILLWKVNKNHELCSKQDTYIEVVTYTFYLIKKMNLSEEKLKLSFPSHSTSVYVSMFGNDAY